MAQSKYTRPWSKSDVAFVFHSSGVPSLPRRHRPDHATLINDCDDPTLDQDEVGDVSGEHQREQETCLYANRLVLSMWSPVFEAMFEDNFQEATMQTILLPGKSAEDFEELLRVTHPPTNEVDCE